MNRDDCLFVDTWLDDWLAGRLPAAAARRIDEHLSACDRCRQLAAIVRDAALPADEPGLGQPPRDGGPDDDLLSGVLARTTGSPCARAEEQLPALVDDELDAGSREILESHLAHCDACSRLLAVLQEARSTLPAFAEIQTPPGFAERVLRATSRLEPRNAVAAWWQRVLSRPRASLEIAYVATVLLVVVLGNPVVAFNEARDRAGQLASAVPVAQLTAQLPATTGIGGAVARWFGGVSAVANALVTEIGARWRAAVALLDAVKATIGDAIGWVKTTNWKRMLGGPHAPPEGQTVRPSSQGRAPGSEPGAAPKR